MVAACTTTGKTSRAEALAHYYKVPVLVLDDVVTEALYYSGTPAAVAARLHCTEAAARAAQADPSPTTDSTSDKPTQRTPGKLFCISFSACIPCLQKPMQNYLCQNLASNF